MIRSYPEQCPSKGSGLRRENFDWSKLVRSQFVKTESYEDHMGEMLEFWGFSAFQVYQRMKTPEQAELLWKAELANPDAVKDMKGKEPGYPDRVLIKTKDVVGGRAKKRSKERRSSRGHRQPQQMLSIWFLSAAVTSRSRVASTARSTAALQS